jgi:1-acyl-sn-glycerol-3-phosphate acyltransferase
MNETLNYNRTKEFLNYYQKMISSSKMHEDTEITPDNVYQEAHKENRGLLLEIMKKCHLPGSNIIGVENVIELNKLAEQGKACLILSEHTSNLDVPSLFTRFYDHENKSLKDIFERFIFIAGTKLNSLPTVKLFTEMFSRVVVYAIRSLNEIKNDEEMKEEVELANKINLKSTRKIGELRNKGYIFFLYATGTRYRPWAPETKKGITAIHSYLNSFDYFCCVSVNGNNMPPEEHEDMTNETILDDVIVFNFGKVIDSKEYLKKIVESKECIYSNDCEGKDLFKQCVADSIMCKIDELHTLGEEYRQKFIQ